MKRTISILSVCIVVFGVLVLLPKTNLCQTVYPQIQYDFDSKYNDNQIELDICLPPGYDFYPYQNYPVIYFTDGYWRKEEFDKYMELCNNQTIIEAIFVGVGYTENVNYYTSRYNDFVVNPDAMLQCICKEVAPYIEKNYRAEKTNRTLWGSSYGSVFCVYAFSQHIKNGSFFKNYITASPYILQTGKNLLQAISDLRMSTEQLPVNLYLTVGGNDDPASISSFKTITQAIEEQKFVNFNFQYEIIPDKNHFSITPETITRGLTKFLPYTSVGIQDISNREQFSLLLDPVSDILTFQFEYETTRIIEIRDLQGNSISSKKMNSSLYTFDITNIYTGVYIYSIIENNNYQSGKIIKN